VPLKQTYTYPFPPGTDPNSTLLITPTAITDVGVFTIIVTIQDDKGASNDYKFKLTITNKAPIVTSNIPYIIVLNFG